MTSLEPIPSVPCFPLIPSRKDQRGRVHSHYPLTSSGPYHSAQPGLFESVAPTRPLYRLRAYPPAGSICPLRILASTQFPIKVLTGFSGSVSKLAYRTNLKKDFEVQFLNCYTNEAQNLFLRKSSKDRLSGGRINIDHKLALRMW